MRRALATIVLATSGCTCGSDMQGDGGIDVQSADDTVTDVVDAAADAPVDVDGVDPCVLATAQGNVVGCDYVAISPSRMGLFPYACLAAVVINQNDAPATVSVVYQGGSEPLQFHANVTVGQGQAVSYGAWPSTNQVPPHTTAILSLAQGDLNEDDTACPNAPMVAAMNEPLITAVANGTAETFRIKTSLPVVAYEVWPYTQNDIDVGNVVALRAVPSWTTSYVDIGTYLPGCDAGGADLPTGNTWAAAAASLAGTIVSMPSAQNGVIGATLAANELLNVARCDEFIGQSVAANNVFALWAGTAGVQVPPYDYVPTSNAPFLEVPQVPEWGHTYAFGPPDSRVSGVSERTFLRLIAAADGTTLTFSPTMPSGAPTALNKGQMGTFYATSPFVVSSQDATHPFFVTAYMVDPRDFDVDGGAEEGSNAMHIIPAVEAWGTRYDLFLPFNYPATEVVVIRPTNGPDVTSDCAGPVVGWQAIDGSLEFARVWMSKDTNGVFNPQVYASGTCDTGSRSFTSTSPFGITAYGWISIPFATYDSLPPPHIGVGSSYAYAPLTAHATIGSSDGGTN
jgi:IgGFc binding protein